MGAINKIPEGFKQTKSGVIPEEWEALYFSDISKINQGLQIPIENRYIEPIEGGYFYITNEFLKEGSAKKYFIKNPPSSVICHEYDILMTRTGNTGTIVTGVHGVFHNNFFKIHYSNKCERLFIYYYLSSPKIQNLILRFAGTSTIPDLNHGDFYKIPIPLPPLPEQQKIAEILSTWDLAISITQNLINELKIRNKHLAHQLLTGKKRLKGFEGNWEEVSLKDIAERVTRKNDELDDTVVTISAKRGFVLQEDFFNKRVASETLSNYYLIHKREFAYNKSYSNGYPMGAFKRLDDFDKAVVTTLYICFSLKDNVNSDFMNQFFEAGFMIRPLMKIAQEGGRAHGLLNIGLQDFFGLKLTLPPLEEQGAITTVLSEADKELKLHQQKLDTLKEQKKGLMQKLLTGEIRVNV